jgi:hypothetical protein
MLHVIKMKKHKAKKKAPFAATLVIGKDFDH